MSEKTIHIEGELSADILTEVASALMQTDHVANTIIIADAKSELILGCCQQKDEPFALIGLCVESALRLLRDNVENADEYQYALMDIMKTAHDRVWEGEPDKIPDTVGAVKSPTIH